MSGRESESVSVDTHAQTDRQMRNILSPPVRRRRHRDEMSAGLVYERVYA